MSDLENNFNTTINNDTNNLVLGDTNNTGTVDDNDPTQGPADEATHSSRLLSINFENIYQNIASYPYRSKYIDDFTYIKFYYKNDGIITVQTEMTQDEKKITTTISGDTGFDEKLIKKEIFKEDNTLLDVTYHKEL